MEQLKAIFGAEDMFYCSVPVPPINDHKASGASFDFTSQQISNYGQAQTHPSILFFPNGWNGHKYWLAATPYPSATGVFENACIYYADEEQDGTPPRVFTPISGTAQGDYTVINNPVVKISSNSAINSDPDLLYDPSEDLLYLVTRDNASTPQYKHYVQISADGQSWTPRDADHVLFDRLTKGGSGQPSWLKIGDKFVFFNTSKGLGNKNLNTGAGFGTLNIIEGNSITSSGNYHFVRRCNIIGKSNIDVYHSNVFVDSSTGYYYLITSANNYDNTDITHRYVYLAESKDGGNTWFMFARPLLSNCSKCSDYYRPSAFIRPSDRMLVVYWSTWNGISTNADDYPNASDIPVDGKRTVGLSYANFDDILSILRGDTVIS